MSVLVWDQALSGGRTRPVWVGEVLLESMLGQRLVDDLGLRQHPAPRRHELRGGDPVAAVQLAARGGASLARRFRGSRLSRASDSWEDAPWRSAPSTRPSRTRAAGDRERTPAAR